MSQTETLNILKQLESLVFDNLQVFKGEKEKKSQLELKKPTLRYFIGREVSYKWLSRNFLVSSNVAKRLLQEFIKTNGSGLQVVYTLAGWLSSNPSSYHINLVSGSKLAEAEKEYDGNCSVQVYSVQACIPKDPAALWNAEFVQAEELFKQPSNVDNCLRDNRFGGISSCFVKRHFEGSPAPEPKTTGISKTNSGPKKSAVPPPQQVKTQQLSPKVDLISLGVQKDVKSESNGTGKHDQTTSTKIPEDKEKVTSGANKKKGQSDKNTSETGSALANMWGRASAKSQATCPQTANQNNTNSDTIVASADAQIYAHDGAGNIVSDEEDEIKYRSGGRKRRVVFDFSDDDDYEDAVNLASPDAPEGKSCLDSKQSIRTTAMDTDKRNPINDKKENEPKQDVEIIKKSKQSTDTGSAVKNIDGNISDSKKMKSQTAGNDTNKKDDVPASPKRRKVLKTRIDERGREVTEVVWEGEETDLKKSDVEKSKKSDSGSSKRAETNAAAGTTNRPAAAKKSPAVGNTAPSNPGGKAGNKKTGNLKDPKQGNILSFFKKV